jgi:hypothetical protein
MVRNRNPKHRIERATPRRLRRVESETAVCSCGEVYLKEHPEEILCPECHGEALDSGDFSYALDHRGNP